MTDSYLKSCQRGNDPLCPVFKLGDIVRDAGEKFSEMAVEVRQNIMRFSLVGFSISFLRFVLHFPPSTTGGRNGHPDQVGLQPGPADAALPPQVLLQEAGREGEQQDALPRPQLPVSQRVKGHFRVTSSLGEHAVNSLCRDSYAKYNTVNGVEERTLFKAFGIRFDVMVFGQVGSSPLPVFTPLGLFKM